MQKFSKISALALALVAGAALATGSMAATSKPAKPAAKAPVMAQTTLYCQLGKSGSNVTVQVVNKGTKDVAKGTVFTYRLVGSKLKPQSYTLKWALGPQKSINITKPMPAAGITGCQPNAA